MCTSEFTTKPKGKKTFNRLMYSIKLKYISFYKSIHLLIWGSYPMKDVLCKYNLIMYDRNPAEPIFNPPLTKLLEFVE